MRPQLGKARVSCIRWDSFGLLQRTCGLLFVSPPEWLTMWQSLAVLVVHFLDSWLGKSVQGEANAICTWISVAGLAAKVTLENKMELSSVTGLLETIIKVLCSIK